MREEGGNREGNGRKGNKTGGTNNIKRKKGEWIKMLDMEKLLKRIKMLDIGKLQKKGKVSERNKGRKVEFESELREIESEEREEI